MEKILFVTSSESLHIPALDFACFLGRLTNSKITGVFLEDASVEPQPILDAPSSFTDLKLVPTGGAIEKNMASFAVACANRSARCSVHRDKEVPLEEVVTESRFADLIVIDPATSFEKTFEGTPTRFVRDLLKEAECPVIIAPESFDGIDEIIFTYNGGRSSVFAIKQFSYLFPELDDKRVILLQVNEEGEWKEKDKQNISEWLQNRYPAIGFEALKGDPDTCLLDYMLKRKNAFIVMGAYGRNPVSTFFRRSQADRLIKIITQPIFISHY